MKSACRRVKLLRNVVVSLRDELKSEAAFKSDLKAAHPFGCAAFAIKRRVRWNEL